LPNQPDLQPLSSQGQNLSPQRRQRHSTSQGRQDKGPQDQEQQTQLRRRKEEALAKLQAVAANLGTAKSKQGPTEVAPLRPHLARPTTPGGHIKPPSH
jgi:hypothetical protein